MDMGINGGFVGMNSYTITSYYVSKHDEPLLTYLGAKGSLFSKNFKKAASEYFSDCPKLVWMIKNKELKKRDIVEIVDYYNKNCGE
ncbi:MAG: hypothetical protein L3J14_08690 [Flavobacteriaceae bacterium]|nr:hypothetical protein [Flavobacteriaceae bacterium]